MGATKNALWCGVFWQSPDVKPPYTFPKAARRLISAFLRMALIATYIP
jgi:hypothetical protein